MNSQQSNLVEKYKKKKCNECNKRRKTLNKGDQICHVCYKMKTTFKSSGNKVIDDFIRHTQIKYVKKEGKLEFVPYDQFKNIEFIAEGGFSTIYKANWTDGPIYKWNDRDNTRQRNYAVVLKKLHNSKKITLKELNELKLFYNFSLKWKENRDKNRKTMETYPHIMYNYISDYFGITLEPITQDFVIIMPYYEWGDLINYISNDFYKISWEEKLRNLIKIIIGLMNIHSVDIIHRDFHSGNIFFDSSKSAVIGDLGISKSATESTDDIYDENYGIIPYMAPEIFQGQKYTKASDIYSFGMIMWELMTGRRPFWDRNHDVNLIIDICDGLRPPIVTTAPEGYIELMKECWHSDPKIRPSAIDIFENINKIFNYEWNNHFCNKNPTKIIESREIGPITRNNPGTFYKSRPLSGMILSAISLRSSRSQSINLETDPSYYYQKKIMTSTDYFTREFELDINNMNFNTSHDNGYITKEVDLDINNL